MSLAGPKNGFAPLVIPSGPAIDTIGPLLVKLLDCAADMVSPKAGRVLVAPGSQVTWDECCDGQLWTRLVSLESLTLAKMGARPVQPCGLTWTATIGVGILRCSSTVDDQGRIASGAAMSMEALQVLSDEAALCKAIYCCEALPMNKFDVVRWDALGPDGGCVGGEWTMTMQVNNYGCSDT